MDGSNGNDLVAGGFDGWKTEASVGELVPLLMTVIGAGTNIDGWLCVYLLLQYVQFGILLVNASLLVVTIPTYLFVLLGSSFLTEFTVYVCVRRAI